jgi:hypothetical protein
MKRHDGPLATPKTAAAANTRVTAWCRVCDHRRQLDLKGLIARGLGDTPLIRLPLVCTHCNGHEFGISVTGDHWVSKP